MVQVLALIILLLVNPCGDIKLLDGTSESLLEFLLGDHKIIMAVSGLAVIVYTVLLLSRFNTVALWFHEESIGGNTNSLDTGTVPFLAALDPSLNSRAASLRSESRSQIRLIEGLDIPGGLSDPAESVDPDSKAKSLP